MNEVPGINASPTSSVTNNTTVTTRRSTVRCGPSAYDQIDQEHRRQHAVNPHQQDVAALRVVGSISDGKQKRAERPHGGRLGWRREPENDRSKRRADEPGERCERRHERPHHIVPIGTLRSSADSFGASFGLSSVMMIDVEHVEPGQHDAGEESAGVELHHRYAGGGAVEDEHDARRNENTEAAAGADHAGSDLDVVARAQHGRKCQQPHQRDAGADNAGRGGKDRAGRERGQRERARHRAGGELQGAEQPVEDVGALDDVAHEDEQRDRDQHVVRHHRVGALDEQIENVVAHREVAEEHAERHQRERDRKTEHDEDDEQGEHQNAKFGIPQPEHQMSPFRTPISSSSLTT